MDEPHVSRDGRWLAYSSNETGQWEVYLQPFMRPGGRVRVSTNGGSQPRWRADGKELFYLALDGAMMSVDTSDPANARLLRESCSNLRFWVNPVEDQYDVTADGQRFLVIVPEGQQATRLTVLTNWPSLLSGRVAAYRRTILLGSRTDAVFRTRPLPPRILCPEAMSYFLRPAFWPALLRPPAAGALAAQ